MNNYGKISELNDTKSGVLETNGQILPNSNPSVRTNHGGCSQAVRQRIVVPPIAGSIPVIYPTWNRSSVGIRAAASMPEATAKRL